MLYEIKVPDASFSVKEAVIVEWHKQIGEKVQEGETIVTVETDKVNVEIPALASGVLAEIRVGAGETAAIGDVLGIIAEEGHELVIAAEAFVAKEGINEPAAEISFVEKREPSKLSSTAASSTADKKGKKKISPVARKIADKEGIDLSQITSGSGPGGRITKEDVLNLVSKQQEVRTEISDKAPIPSKMEKEMIRFVGWRKVIADRMISSARDVPQGRTLIEIDVTDLTDFIRSMKERGDGPRITYLPFLMKAIQAGIEITPEVNAYCYDDGFVLQKELNIGVAVDLGEKLVVPVVKRVHDKSILELADEVHDLGQKAKAGNLQPEDVQDGTITVTNLGAFDAFAAEPLILPPQTTIVAMGTVRDEPGIINGSIEIRKKVMITGVFDHRVVNGAPGSRFLKQIKDDLENIKNIILRLR